jgi:hypothetical protein
MSKHLGPQQSRFQKHRASLFLIVGFAILASCASLYTGFDEKLLENKEFDKHIQVKEMPVAPPEAVPGAGKATPPPAPLPPLIAQPKKKLTKKEAKKIKIEEAAHPTGPAKHLPPLEDGEGFDGRRPLVDPFTENEKLSYSVSYFGLEAGRFTTTIGPFVQVNGRKSYHFIYDARSSSVFSMFYKVEDSAEAFMDYESLVPYSYSIKARETKQARDVKDYFNWQTMKANLWDKKLKKGEKVPQEKNLEWDLLPYSQNVFTVAFYLRTFTLSVGKKLAVRVAHDGENIIMRAKVLREEKITTSGGTFDTYVIQPQFELNGVFKPVGAIYLWLTKDEHKYLVHLESKIKIGTIVVDLEKIGP